MIAAVREALAERYRLERELGEGGMATVYLARDLKHDRQVAVKVLRLEHIGTAGASRFLQEIRLAARLTHPNVVSLYDSGEIEGSLYYVMPYVEGETLRQRLERERELPVEEALRIARDIADALSYAHERGVIHRDIKPENILLSRGHALLTDFGIARAAAEAGGGSLTTSGSFVGTPLYTSPEQAAGRHPIDARADVYSLACVVYEMLAGEPPFTGPTVPSVLAKHALEARPSVRTVRDTVPREVDDALRKAMARVPADRFGAVAEFMRALGRSAAAEYAVSPRAPGRFRRVAVWAALAGGTMVGGYLLIGVLPPLGGEQVARLYAGPPIWSEWVNLSGDYFTVVAATDSALVIHAAGGDSVYTYRNGWTAFSIPDPLTLRPFDGRLPLPRLLAAAPATNAGGEASHYSWLELEPGGLREAGRLPGFGPDALLPQWWTDGAETVALTDGLERLQGDRWVRETTGTAGPIAQQWGRDIRHRFALSQSAPDSVLVYDGISWNTTDILPGRSAGTPAYHFGASLRDGATVVLGEVCDTAGCEQLILQQDSFGGAWHRLHLAEKLGVPVAQPVRSSTCGPDQFDFRGAAGESRSDYYVWGEWVRCERTPNTRFVSGCPADRPCSWHVADGRLVPLDDLRGVVIRAVLTVAGITFALAEDGTLWRRMARGWRPVDQVPGLPARMVAASSTVVVRLTGERLTYEPGASDSVSWYFVNPLGPRGLAGGIRAIAVRDSVIALLATDGSVLRSACGIAPDVAGTGGRSLACDRPVRMSGPAALSTIAVLAEGDILAVGPRQVVRWHAGGATRERLPADAARDTLWAVQAAPDGSATVAGHHTLLQRTPDGAWRVLRRFPRGEGRGAHFAMLADGDVAVANGWLRLWQHNTDTPPLATLRRPELGEGTIAALHALADGRLIAGLAHPDARRVGGWIEVWAAPVTAGRSERVRLPLNVDVTSIADDGTYLIVSGRGGTMSMPLTSLPFYAGGTRE